MQWQEVRAHYPNQWVLVEALAARSDADKRIVDELAVVGTFPDSALALRRYRELHHEAPMREFYVVHTSRGSLDITERQWLGVRASR
jgi:hypothetical protein